MKKQCAKVAMQIHTPFIRAVAGITIAIACAVQPNVAHATSDQHIETLFQNVVSNFLNLDIYQSMTRLQLLLAKQPDFAPARIVYAELLTAYAHQNTLLSLPDAVSKTRIRGIAQETLARLSYDKPNPGDLPKNIMQLSSLHKYAMLLDATRSRIYVFQNKKGKPKLIADHYVSIGKGGMNKTEENDEKTPTGIYHVLRHLDGKTLPELYGDRAYTLNYPNAWDRLTDHTGYGIWLHGTPRSIYSRPPLDSRGCIVLSNHLLKSLENYITPELTPVILARQVEWLSPQDWEQTQHELLTTIERWKNDWTSRDTQQYLSHYSKNYRTHREDYESMVQQTQYHAKQKEYIKVNIENIDLFYYPNMMDQADNTMVAIFDQDYRSSNYNSQYRKQQIWQNENQEWKIVYADKAEMRNTPFQE